MCGQVAAQLFSLCSDFAELKGTGMFRAISDGIANFRLCRLPESWQLRDPTGFTCGLQIRDRATWRFPRALRQFSPSSSCLAELQFPRNFPVRKVVRPLA